MGKNKPFAEADDVEGQKAEQEYAASKQAGTEVDTPKAPRTMSIKAANGDAELTTEQLKSMSLDELQKAFGATLVEEVVPTDQYGPILEEKTRLIGKPFVIVHWTFNPDGEFGEFVTMFIMTNDGDQFIVNDGSTGIYGQLRSLTNSEGINSMLVCKRGFRVSEYDKELPNGKTIPAKTYYLDTKLTA